MEDVNKHIRSFSQHMRAMHFLPSVLLGGGGGTLAPSHQDRNHQPFWRIIWKNIKLHLALTQVPRWENSPYKNGTTCQ